jgi:dienelactone hydrolase
MRALRPLTGVLPIIIAGALWLCLVPTARAQPSSWLEPADTSAAALGPDKAAGAVVWSHGRSVDSEDSQALTPPYMAMLRAAGWDTFRFNRLRASDTLSASGEALRGRVHALRQQGYRHVALAGQSFGAFLSLIAADANDEVDTVIATAPAAYGSFADFYETWRSNAVELYPLLEQVRRARVMLFFFHGDDFDPGGRGERSRAILAARGLPAIVIDQPPRLTTHWAAATPQFAQDFGGCIAQFLSIARLGDDARCDGDGLWAGTPALKTAQPRGATAPGDKSGGG